MFEVPVEGSHRFCEFQQGSARGIRPILKHIVFDNVLVEALAHDLRPSAHDLQTFIHVLVVLTVFLFTAFSASFCFPHLTIPRNLAAIFVKTKAKTSLCLVLSW